MSILLVDCYLDKAGGAGSFLPYLPSETVVWHVSQGEAMPVISNISGVVITGSAACVHDSDLWIETLFRFLSKMIVQEIPCFGICFGHQALAKVCGAEIGFLSIPEVGWKTVSCVEESPLWIGVSAEFKVFLSHRDVVLSLGNSLVCLASSAECGVQAFHHKEQLVWGIQFHPEMLVAECLKLMEWRRKKHSDLVLDWAKEQGSIRSNAPLAQKFFDNFLALLV